jgi:hypothetical protein
MMMKEVKFLGKSKELFSMELFISGVSSDPFLKEEHITLYKYWQLLEVSKLFSSL